MKGLIIKPKWADLILSGAKTWEIRSRRTHIRGTIAIIKSGSGQIFGTVELVDCLDVTLATYMNSRNKHCIQVGQKPDSIVGAHEMKAWVLTNPVIYPEPIPYIHPQGAVIWVNLANSV
ncbi:hypothetical protein BBD42_30960 [Paenibacillus sp. BIHB 4019]|uniref:ASCH domain-containing protein n=1 Tax=Paenibacillus sp. BIHB 4019 TaxID=1870819 RepID=A0A1B2DRU3_9BACL|nr:ASCH domain-containing protein [Paenibacillus sp. BIHB 4019]ANY70425.1 hypothetical protein BBD42_30960 [Paenibacillus sp. BIHB 4019]